MQIAYAQRHWRDGLIMDATDESPLAANGLALGDGLFETVAFRQNRLHDLDAHLRRLRTGLAFFGIAGVPTDDELVGACQQLLVGAPSGKTLRVRITVVRQGKRASTEIAYAPYLVPERVPPFRIASVIRPAGNPSARFKTLAYVDQLAAQREVGPMHTALLLNQWGRVACGAFGNVWALLDGRWVTPPVAEGALPGIERGKLLAAGRHQGLLTAEATIEPSALVGSRLLYTNSLISVRATGLA